MNTRETQTRKHRPYHEKYLIREASYRQQSDELTLIRINPHHHEQIRSSILQPVRKPTSSSSSSTSSTLGHFDMLPLEILHKICRSLDLASLLNFYQTNPYAQQIVCSLRIDQMIVPHAPGALSAILQTNTAPMLTLRDLLELLLTRNCNLCDNSFGGFIFLPSMIRWCFSCVDTNPKIYEYLVRLFWPELRYSPSIREMFHGLNIAGTGCADCSGREMSGQ